MPRIIKSYLNARGKKFAIIASRTNHIAVESVLNSTITTLVQHGVRDMDITVVKVPGAFEVPLTALRMAEQGCFDAVISLAAIINDRVLGAAITVGTMEVGLKTQTPVLFGAMILDENQKLPELTNHMTINRGYNAALAAVEMTCLVL